MYIATNKVRKIFAQKRNVRSGASYTHLFIVSLDSLSWSQNNYICTHAYTYTYPVIPVLIYKVFLNLAILEHTR